MQLPTRRNTFPKMKYLIETLQGTRNFRCKLNTYIGKCIYEMEKARNIFARDVFPRRAWATETSNRNVWKEEKELGSSDKSFLRETDRAFDTTLTVASDTRERALKGLERRLALQRYSTLSDRSLVEFLAAG